MADNEAEIRTLIERWADAVHTGDLTGVLADHSDDIVMYDVPPPYDGVRGVDAYRDTWPPFFEWQAQGALFELTSLDITAGDTVAYAVALVRCGMPKELAEKPGLRLRLTLGLRNENGRWIVAHEHHSFPDDTAVGTEETAGDTDDTGIRALHQHWYDATAAKDLDGLMANIADDVVSYEHEELLQHVGQAKVREVCRRGLESSSGLGTWEVPDLKVVVRGDIAVTWGSTG